MKIEVNSKREVLIYSDPNGSVKVEILLQNESVWLTQQKMAEVFGVDRTSVGRHLRNIFAEGELVEEVVCAEIAHTTPHGAIAGKLQQKSTKYYNLDAIISVGYRVNSTLATQFRIWATSILREYLIKGFAMNDERLKNPNQIFGKDYFEEQLARIRDIRSSERRFYQKITDIYAQCSCDYSADSELTKQFFARVQNKLHWAISHQTAAEIIHSRADSQKENMGLTNWKNSPKGAIRKGDVVIAKNYLSQDELESLNRIVSAYLDFAEMQARKYVTTTMEQWIKKLDDFLEFAEYNILSNTGTISAQAAHEFALAEYEKFREKQINIYQSDFDRLILSNNE